MEESRSIQPNNAPKPRSKAWITVVLFICAIIAMAAAWAVLGRGSGAQTPVPTPPVPGFIERAAEDPTQRPTQAPSSSEFYAATPAPTQSEPTPAPTAQTYSRTAIVIDGGRRIVMSSREAAEELLRNVQTYFETLGDLPDNAVTQLDSKVTFEEARRDETVMSYDAAFELLTAPNTPLVFKSVSTYVEDTVIPHRDIVITDTMLPKGIRVARLVGRDGLERKVWSTVYLNGVLKETTAAETYTVIEAINGDYRIGARVFPEGYVTKPGFGSDPVMAHALMFRPPIHGSVITFYGPIENGFHHGIDIAAEAGTQVLAACSGTVVSVMERGSYGLMVEIQHDRGVTTRYARLADVCVSIGDHVELGDPIAAVSPDNHVAHLHFELRIKGTAYNPLKVIPRMSIEG